MNARRALVALALAGSALAAQQPAEPCYRFNVPLFVRVAWHDGAAKPTTDTTSLIQLTNAPHPRDAIARDGAWRVVRAFLPPADSVYRRTGWTTSWRSPAPGRIAIAWFTTAAAWTFALETRGDTLAGQATNQGDTADNGRQVLKVKAVRVTCGVTAPTPAEERYIATRDSAARSIAAREERGDPSDSIGKAEHPALVELERQAREIIGPVMAPGFIGPGKFGVVTFASGNQDSDGPDVIQYESHDRRSTLAVTTLPLFRDWLRRRRLPLDPLAALRYAVTYTYVISMDAAVSRYADIPVRDSARLGVVAAMLVFRAQDIGPFTPDEVVVAAIRGSRVMIVASPAAATIAPAPRCLAVRDSMMRIPDRDKERYLRETLRDSSELRDALKFLEADDVAYRRCYAQHVKREPAFERVIAQVTGIAAALPPR